MNPAIEEGLESEQPQSLHKNGNGASKAKNLSMPDLSPIPSDIKNQLKILLKTAKIARQGDFTVRFPTGDDLVSEIGEVLNDIIELNENMTNEFARVAK